MCIQTHIILLLIVFPSIVVSLLNPYRKCAHNPLYTSNSMANYMFAMPLTFIQQTDSLIYYNVKHYGFTLKNPALSHCSNFFISNTSCCNSTTLSQLLNHTKTVYQSYGSTTKSPIFSLAKDLSSLLMGSSNSCLLTNGSLGNFKLPGINGQTLASVSGEIATAYSNHDSKIQSLVEIEKSLVKSQSCLLCLATQDWDHFIHPNASIIYSTSYYSTLISNYTNILTSLNTSSFTLQQYMLTFLSKNINQTKCQTLYNNYTTRVGNSGICTGGLTCEGFAKKYFGQFLIPGVLWKLNRIYLNRSDAVAMYQMEVMGGEKGFKGNISYVAG